MIYLAFGKLISRGRRSFARYVDEDIRARPGDRFLDLGCGPAYILDFLPSVEYYGIDINPTYIEAARRRYAARGSFYCQPVASTPLLGTEHIFDIVLASGLLHHLSDGEAGELFKLSFLALKPGGRLVTFDGCYVEGQGWLARYLLSRDRGAFVRDVGGYLGLARQVFAKVEFRLYNDLLRVPYTHIVLSCERQ